MTFSKGFEDKLLDIAEWVDENKYLNSIKDAFTVFMPFVIVGSFGTLLKTLISSSTTGLAQWFPALANLAPAFTALNFCTLSFMTIPIVFLIAMNMARHNKTPEYVTGVVAVAAYVSLVAETFPLQSTLSALTANGTALSLDALGLKAWPSVAAMATTTFGAQGLFVGMIVALLVAQLFGALCKIDAIKIKMPPSVPAGIATSFNVMIPIAIVLLVTSILGILFQGATGYYINEWIYAVMQAPMEAIMQTPAGIIVLVIASQLFWLLGIHGGLVVTPVRNPLLVAALAANIAAVEAGGTATNLVTLGFWSHFIALGGAGYTLSLIFATFLVSKREDHRAVAKLGLLPGLCGISEPIVFGMPLVLNPTFAIPFVFNSSIATAIALFFNGIGFLPANTFDVPFGIPILISGFVGWGIPGVIVQAICLAVCTLVWIPFVLVANREAEKELSEADAETIAA